MSNKEAAYPRPPLRAVFLLLPSLFCSNILIKKLFLVLPIPGPYLEYLLRSALTILLLAPIPYLLAQPRKGRDPAASKLCGAAGEGMDTLSLLSTALDWASDGIVVRGPAAKTVYHNRRFTEMWNVPQQVLETRDDVALGEWMLQQVNPDQHPPLRDHRHCLPQEDGRYLYDLRDGRFVEAVCATVASGQGPAAQVTRYSDVTLLKNLEHQLRHARKMEEVGTLIGEVSHDFRNILTGIMGLCSLSAEEADSAAYRGHLADIMEASTKALTITNSLLTYVRKESTHLEPVELNATVRGAEKFLTQLLGEDIALVMKLWEEDIVVQGDGILLEQVLMNLATNARDAMLRRGRLSIVISKVGRDRAKGNAWGRSGTFALICVSDTGSGMDRQTRERIFDPFFTTKPSGKGTGLGMSIVHRIVKQHDGHIAVRSEPGKGTDFEIYLPVLEGTEQERQRPAAG